QRDHDDHRERHAVALELDELLDQHGPGLAPEAGTRDAPGRIGRDKARGLGHWKLSRARPMRSMNTSSSEGCDGVQSRPARWNGATAASSLALSRPETCRLLPNGATMSMPGVRVSSSASAERPLPSGAATT